eukprot:Nk52_evm5s1992 gene=Nk52_evmTU5s1992
MQNTEDFGVLSNLDCLCQFAICINKHGACVWANKSLISFLKESTSIKNIPGFDFGKYVNEGCPHIEGSALAAVISGNSLSFEWNYGQGVKHFRVQLLEVEGLKKGLFLILLTKIAGADKLPSSNQIIESISQIQESYLEQNNIMQSFANSLNHLLHLTGSEYGFIGEKLIDENGNTYLHTHAVTDISWNEATREFYMQNAPFGWDFKNMETLFGICLITDEVVISNNPETDKRRGGKSKIPHGHPKLNCFLGMPIRFGRTITGMAGIANRKGGYTIELADCLMPLMNLFANLFKLYHLQGLCSKMEMSLKLEKNNSMLANSAKATFLKNISHEVRTPLNAITSISSVVLETTDPEDEMAPLFQVMQSSANLLLSLFEDVLLSRKLLSGCLQLTVESFAPRDIVDEATKLTIYNARSSSNLNLNINCFADESTKAQVVGDKSRFLQVIINLLGNSIKYCEGADIRIYARSMDGGPGSNRRLVNVRVEDDGPGFKKGKTNAINLFDYFSTLPDASEAVRTGSGMGLPICYSLCNIQGGDMWIDDISNGSSVQFVIPYALEIPNVTLKMGQLVLGERSDESSKGKAHMLLVSQSIYWGDIFSAYCKEFGFDLIIARNTYSAEVILADPKRKDHLCYVFVDIGSMCGYIEGDSFPAPWVVIHIIEHAYSFKHIHLLFLCESDSNGKMAIYEDHVFTLKLKMKEFSSISHFHTLIFETSSICLNCKSSHICVNMVATEEQKKVDITTSCLSKEKCNASVIVALDNLVFREMVVGVLSDADVKFVEISDSRNILPAIKNSKEIDTVIIDLFIRPVDIQYIISGIDEYAQSKGISSPKLILCQASVRGEMRQCLKDITLTSFIQYPCSFDTISDKIFSSRDRLKPYQKWAVVQPSSVTTTVSRQTSVKAE